MAALIRHFRSFTPPPIVRLHAWRVWLVMGVAFAVLYLLIPSQGVQNVVYQFPGTLAVVAILAGVWMHRPADPRPWLILAGGLALSTLGDWTWTVLQAMGQEPFPSVADVFYIGGLAMIIAALLLLVRGRVPGGDRSGVLDALIIACGVGLVSWVFLMAPIVANQTQSFEEIAVALAYPVGDVLLIGVLARLFLVSGRKVPALYLVLAALSCLLLADYVYAVLALANAYQTGQVIDTVFLVAPACWGAAALHPSMRVVAEPVEQGQVRFSFWRFAALAGASLMAPAVLVIQWLRGEALDVPVIAAGSVVLFLLVIARLGGLVTDLRATLTQRKILEDELKRQALTDPLTGLANRVLFHDRLDHALARREGRVAVLFIDLDDFKTVNDVYGHDPGDVVIRAVADDLRRTVRPGDTAARLGGDEFAVLLEGSISAYEAGVVAERILASVATPTSISIGGHETRDYSIGASIGIALGAHGSSSAAELMRQADIAMYVAKGQGKGRFSIFEPSTHAPVLRSLELRTDLEEAVRDQRFEIHYQPILDLATGALAGMEALVRWRHPTRGLLSPAEFIPLAETTGAILPLGRWILHEACREAVGWRSAPPNAAALLTDVAAGRPPSGSFVPMAGGQRPFMSVNLSAVQLSEAGFADAVARTLEAVGLAARDLVLETTETTRLDQESATLALRHLRLMGIRLAIDDFGTGYASLSQLQSVPFDVVKIDRGFVASLGVGSRADAIVAGIVELAHQLRIQVIAEGIDTREQLVRLRELGCSMGQGFYFAPPLPAGELRARLGMPLAGRPMVTRGPVAPAPRPVTPAFLSRPRPS